jgi:hypothetical protein
MVFNELMMKEGLLTARVVVSDLVQGTDFYFLSGSPRPQSNCCGLILHSGAVLTEAAEIHWGLAPAREKMEKI